jgi:hypothetical protein
MKRMHRRSAPRVVDGVVQRQNRWQPTSDYWNTPQRVPAVDRRRPGKGYRHVLRKDDVMRFIDLLPNWEELSRGVNAIVLAPGNEECDGWYDDVGVVAVCAWERELHRTVEAWWYAEHRDIFDRIEVACVDDGDGGVLCRFTEANVRGYQLLHVLLHELGHHHDRRTTRSRREPSRGEKYANRYAREYEQRVFARYLDVFGLY